MKAYICIGGPLDGQFASGKDFQSARKSFRAVATNFDPDFDTCLEIKSEPDGKFASLGPQYKRYNAGGQRGGCTMVWLHVSLLRDPVTA